MALVRRPARIAPPRVPTEPVTISDPPGQHRPMSTAMSISMIIMPVVSGAGSLLVTLTNRGKPLYAVAGLLFLVASVAVGAIMLISQRSGPRRETREARERYLDYIEHVRTGARATIGVQRRAGRWSHPDTARLLDIARLDARRWERRRTDDDFLQLRFGVGDQPLATPLRMASAETPLAAVDPVCQQVAHDLRGRYSVLHDQPVWLGLRELGVLSVVGDRAGARAVAGSLIAQLLTFHSPEDVQLAVVRDERHAPPWDWAKWAPHCQEPAIADGALAGRLVAASVPALAELLDAEIQNRLDALQRRRGQRSTNQRQLVVVVDGEHLSSVWGLHSPDPTVSLADLGVHLVLLLGHRREEPETVDDRILVGPDATAVLESTGRRVSVDRPEPGLLPALARLLAPLRAASEDTADALSDTVGLPEILGVPDAGTLDPGTTWQPRPPRDFLRVPIGVDGERRLVMLDLKESAHGGMGPHGLIVGATGSGKSELLRTLVSSLAINHSPDRLAMLLVDFKGGATFASMDRLPHLAGMITNLQDDLSLVDRMRDALYGEMQRRQELLKQAGNLPNAVAYQALRDRGAPLEPLPELLVIIDEFSELLTARPDFAEMFVAVGRIGRSIGVHLLLATQRLEMGKIRGLESHLSYRIGLRTFSDAESREAIGVPDAYQLPPEPGSGYLKVDTTVFTRFKAALVSAPYQPPAQAITRPAPVVPYVSTNGLGAWLSTDRSADQGTDAAVGAPSEPDRPSVLDVLVDRIAGAGTSVRSVWLDPLPAALPLDRVQQPTARAAAGTVAAALGLVDDPTRQAQFPLEWDFGGASGNLVVNGAPQSGKSTVLRTLLCSLALRYAPGDVVAYCIDFGGGGLQPLAELPHVAGVATRSDPERLRRIIGEVSTLVDRREDLFREQHISSASDLRAARADGRLPADTPGDVFLVIDGWASFRDEYELLEDVVGDIAARGLNYGVHVVLAVTQSMQLRMRMQSSFSGHIDLRLNDAFDTQFDRTVMQQIDKQTPGRALIEGNLIVQFALPRIDGEATVDGLAAAQRALVRAVTERWPRGVARVHVLPTLLPAAQLPPASPDDIGVPIGVSERDLEPVGVDLESGDPHLLVYGDGETGKTNLLRVLIDGYLARRSPAQLGIVLVDYRRTLLDVVPPEYLLAYCTAQQQTTQVAQEIAGSLAQRLPGPDVTSEQLRTRSWWKGLEVLYVVDDYDLVATGSGNPLLPLVDYLPQARDLGFHLVVARRTGGASRVLFEPLLQSLNDLSTPGLLFSGDRMEGRLVNGAASQRLPQGRALYASRSGAVTQVQTAWAAPDQ
ncbi:type VII secretion protein EccC [Actinocatenispora thailandica]|uniref:Type VII secretion protein EccC n=2 Tax=Actinocatenispora thailandica TaxID=227318 RepID=A0A7R7HZF7_9ACTN|nr:type VII secretion protein EccC [Actinocatenispora thailandica]